MNEYLIISLKTILFLTIILVIIRVMGKRELGQLNVFDIIISFMISEIFSNAIAEPDSNIFLALLPILIIFVVQLLISVIVLKNKKIRNIIESKPSLIIKQGVINYKEMKKQRYNISDLLQQLRTSGIDNLEDVYYAILESNGALSVILKEDKKLLHPFPLISDSEIDFELINDLNITNEWLIDKLLKMNLNIKDVFMAFVSTSYELIVFSKKLNNVI